MEMKGHFFLTPITLYLDVFNSTSHPAMSEITMSNNIKICLVLIVFLFTGCSPTSESRPNIVLIIADDLAFSDLGSYGGEISTPHLDALANDGVRYTQFYTNPGCVATRASLYSGLYPAEGLAKLRSGSPSLATLGELLKSSGYQTSLTGKWHLGHEKPNRPIDRGFDEHYGLLDGASNYFDPAIRDPEFYNGGAHRVFAR